jgi:hypothetical protein
MTTLGGALMPHVIVEGLTFDTLAPSALAGLCVLLIFVGRLVPRRAVDDLIREHERVVEDISHDRDEWRAAHRISEAARADAVAQVQELLEHARTTDAFIRSLPHPLYGPGGEKR